MPVLDGHADLLAALEHVLRAVHVDRDVVRAPGGPLELQDVVVDETRITWPRYSTVNETASSWLGRAGSNSSQPPRTRSPA